LERESEKFFSTVCPRTCEKCTDLCGKQAGGDFLPPVQKAGGAADGGTGKNTREEGKRKGPYFGRKMTAETDGKIREG